MNACTSIVRQSSDMMRPMTYDASKHIYECLQKVKTTFDNFNLYFVFSLVQFIGERANHNLR